MKRDDDLIGELLFETSENGKSSFVDQEDVEQFTRKYKEALDMEIALFKQKI